MSTPATRRPAAAPQRPRDGGPPGPKVRRSVHRMLVRALLSRPIPMANVFIWMGPTNPELSLAARIAVGAVAVLLLAQSLWSELRTSVEIRPGELVVTNSFARYVLRPADIRRIRYGAINSGPVEVPRTGLEIDCTRRGPIPLQVSVGLSRRRRERLHELLRDWAGDNRVGTDLRKPEPAGKQDPAGK
ncbi:hypothetical protein [Kitasatospora sp. NPDC004272]